MNEEDDYPSDTSDEDYVPTDGEAVSEDEGSGEDEAPLDGQKEQDQSTTKSTGKRKRTKKKSDLAPRKRQGGIRLDDKTADDDHDDDDPPAEKDYNKQLEKHLEIENEEKKELNEKKKADNLWADFMKDVGPTKAKPKLSSSLSSLSSTSKPASTTKSSTSLTSLTNTGNNGSRPASSNTKSGKITITKEYDFAGEMVQVTKEVDADSKEAKAELMKHEQPDVSKPTDGPSLAVLKRPAGGGLGSVLGKIGKKQKISTLEKSQLDWNNFKQKEGIDDELQIHNRGKQSYIERQAFLERTDYRQFEIERNLRLSNSKR